MGDDAGEGDGEKMTRNQKITFARDLRKNQTDAEKLVWIKLKGRRFNGVKFRRQQQIGTYIVDFVTFEKKLIIEIDGSQHNTTLGRRHDTIRTRWLESNGFTILRFWNNDVMRGLNDVLEVIHKTITFSHS